MCTKKIRRQSFFIKEKDSRFSVAAWTNLLVKKITQWCGNRNKLEQGTEVCSKNRSAVKGVWPMAGESNEKPHPLFYVLCAADYFHMFALANFYGRIIVQDKWLSVRGGL